MYFIKLYLHPHQIVVRESPQSTTALISTTQRWLWLESRQARDLDYRPHLDGAFARHGNPSGNADRLVEIVCLDKEVAAQLFSRLRERTIGHKPFAVAHPD